MNNNLEYNSQTVNRLTVDSLISRRSLVGHYRLVVLRQFERRVQIIEIQRERNKGHA